MKLCYNLHKFKVHATNLHIMIIFVLKIYTNSNHIVTDYILKIHIFMML